MHQSSLKTEYACSRHPAKRRTGRGQGWWRGWARRVTYTYDAHGNLPTATDLMGGVTKYAYNERGQLISTTDATGNTTT